MAKIQYIYEKEEIEEIRNMIDKIEKMFRNDLYYCRCTENDILQEIYKLQIKFEPNVNFMEKWRNGKSRCGLSQYG